MASNCSDKLLINENMKRITSFYQEIRGLAKEKLTDFWDCVVLTTADEDQTKLYNYILERKKSSGTFPKDVPHFIFADPPGPKIGSGGSILYSLSNLYKEWGDDLYQKKIIIVCVGGQSQRLPTGTFLGKLSLDLPLEESDFDMFDLKMAMYLPFVRKMKFGVFVTCSDDVETYSGLDDTEWSFTNDGFTALGHLSSVEIGRHHGVYVLNPEQLDLNKTAVTSQCLRVLQKPSYEQMKESGAILDDGRVCTDSVFFFDHNVSCKLVNYMSDDREITNEIDAYKHFLQPLGEKAPLIGKNSEVSMENDLYQLLYGTAINVILLTKSNFYHLGTMAEYVDNMTWKSIGHNDFYEEMNFRHLSHSLCCEAEVSVSTTVLHSIVERDSVLKPNSVIEWSRVSPSVSVASRCIISHCHISSTALQSIAVPSDCCFHTVAVQINDHRVKFVTIAFGIDDDIKAAAIESEWQTKLKYLGVTLGNVVDRLGLDANCLFSGDVKGGCSLWKIKLFPVANSMEESFRHSLIMVRRVLQLNNSLTDADSLESQRLSLFEMVKLKSVETMMEFKEELSRYIINKSKEKV